MEGFFVYFSGHPISEIRIRALQSIETKLKTCLRNSDHLVFNCPLLIKKLIRWFDQHNSVEPARVLDLLLLIFKVKSNVKKKLNLILIDLLF